MSAALVTPLEMFYRWEQETPDKVYLRQPKNLEWSEHTWRDVGNRVRRIAAFLRDKNYPAGSRIGIWSSNSMDWPICDLAIMLAGHISVPIYPGQDIGSANYIFNHSAVKLVFCGDFDQHARVTEALPEGVETVAMLGCKFAADTSLDEVIASYEPYLESPVPNGEDVFTIIYTSGTTGNPKGVMHMHQTPGHVVPGLVISFRMNETPNEFFSFLPMSHAAERIIVEMTSLYSNASISFSESLDTFGDEVRSVQPTFFFAVPRLWVKFKAGIDAKIPPEAQAGLNDEQKAGIAQALGLSRARCIITGSAPCPVDVQDWFLSMGIALRDGYGMTENFVHGIAWTKDDQPISGCVGQPMDPSVQVRVSDAGEIQFKSLGLMKGYYLNEEKTAEVFDDGWYCTGDSGRFDDDGNLWVTGRVSEVFKTSKGKFIVPMKLESLFGRNPNLAQFCCMGHGLDQPIVLVTLSEVGLAKDRAAVQAELESLLEEINSEVPSYERISNIFVCDEWTIENALLTPTMKLKRKQIEDEYKALVQSHMGAGPVSFLD
ncbi:AMP-binding protein [Halioglobus japonicus]|uniref:AMP-binding protein n=1 Tax=Halioglobus japonicus TaxID=930805 RepID=A0AAP8MC67_9GAMM|nr:AMP-binding protein [Halioglobus japonicus]AQA17207.1 AMP-binding protein [Halioglobus japonicus]PLW85122.1 AMP-binding protein [Halioglobus japonicus]GHD19558.1 long-chain acyl-CoA synthetase [Halioglobus japonicus]